jgi:hypothetical protein
MVADLNGVLIYRGMLALENVATAINYYGILEHWDKLACKGWQSIKNPHMLTLVLDL